MNSFGHAADHYLQLSQAAYACSQAAWVRRDMVAHERAEKLFHKYVHKWNQAKAREKRRVIDRIQESK